MYNDFSFIASAYLGVEEINGPYNNYALLSLYLANSEEEEEDVIVYLGTLIDL